MKNILLVITILFIPFWMLAQKSPIWSYSISWKVSDLAKKEIGIDYDFLKTDRHIFSLSTGFKWHSIEKSLRYEGTKTNFFVATNKFHHHYIKMNVTAQMDFYFNPVKTMYFNDTKSLTRLGTFAPEFSIPIGFAYARKLGPELKRVQIWLKVESILFFHKGYSYTSRAVALNDYGYTPEFAARISKYQENVTAKRKVTSNLDFALGILTRIRIFDSYFIGINSKAQFRPNNAYNPSNYHGLQRINARLVVSVGKYINPPSPKSLNSTSLE